MRPTALAFLGLAACVHAGRPASAPISFRVEVSGHGPPVILIPDLAAPASVWNTTVADAFLELMQLDLRGKLRASRVPVLAVVTDLAYPPEAWPGILAGWHRQIDPIPHHGLVEVHGAHHYVMFDRPDAWFAALDAFLER